MEETLKIGKQFRSFIISRDDIDNNKRTVALSFSSESPVERWFGYEILDHDNGAVDLKRLKRGGALLIDHDTRNQVGVIEEVLIDQADRKGRAIVRFGRSAKAEEIFQDVTDEIRKNVSVSYVVHEMRLEKEEKDGPNTYRVTRWEPLEVSFVSIPADLTVGVGRAEESEKEIRVLIPDKKPQEQTPEEQKKEAEMEIEVKAIEEETRKAEQHRVAEILAIGEKHKCHDLARRAITDGKSIDEFKTIVLEKVYKAKEIETPDPSIGMSEKEVAQFSILRAINAILNHSWKGAELERDASEAVAKRLGKNPQGFFVPIDVLKRDLVKGTASAGGYTVATDLLAASFIEMLRNKMIVRSLGATILGGLVGDIAIPKTTGGATAYWVAESGAPTESQQTFGQVALAPKTVGAYTDISRKLLLQSSIDVEGFVRADLATALALAIDLAAINGSGASNQPTGILNTTGIGDVAGGTNGAAPTYAHIIELETDVAIANADIGSLAYLSNAKARGKLKNTFTNATYGEIPLWQNAAEAGRGVLNGYRAEVSNQVPSDLDKGTSVGVCSAIIFGNWSDLIVGEWGALDVLVDPYTGGTSGTVRVRVLQDVDIAVRHAESFSAMKDALTT